MNDFEKSQLMSEEIDRLREEISISARSVHRTVFVFLTAFAAIISVYFGKELMSEVHKAVLILLLSQLEVVLCLFCASLLSYQYVRVGYIRALEKRINELAKENLIIWDSKITPKYMAGKTCAFFFTCLLQVIAYIVIFLVLICFTFELTNHFLCGVGFTIEALICLGAHIWSLSEINMVERFAKEKQGEAIE